MSTELVSAVKVFEEVEKIRKSCEVKLAHLARNRLCSSCGKDWMPRSFEPCPECKSTNTKMMRQKRKCLDCEHAWQPSEIGVCPWCGSPESEPHPRTDEYIRDIAIPRLRGEEDFYEQQLREMVVNHPAWEWARQVKGVGTTTIGRLIGKTDIHRVNTVSEMWAHSGYGLMADGTRQRKRAGQKINYDAHLQSNCVMLGESLMRQRDSYYDFYLQQKEAHPELTLAHRHNRAFRHMIKLFLSHFWQTWRQAEDLPAPAPFAFAILNHPSGHFIKPEEMVKKPAGNR